MDRLILLPEDIIYNTFKFLDFLSFYKFYIAYPQITASKIPMLRYKNATKICEKYLSQRINIIHKINKLPFIKSSFDFLINKKYYKNKILFLSVKDAGGKVYSCNITIKNLYSTICDHTCPSCMHFYPSLLCMIVCGHHCTCNRCIDYMKYFANNDFFYHSIKELNSSNILETSTGDSI